MPWDWFREIRTVAEFPPRQISALYIGLFAGGKPLAALGAFDLLRIDAADFVRRNRASALRADRIERSLNFFQIDFLLLGHLPSVLAILHPERRL